MSLVRLVLVASVLCFVAAEKDLPDYIKACQRSDPKRGECARQHAMDALPTIVKGDKNFKIPVLAPFTIPLINIDQGTSFKLKMENGKVDGLQHTTFDSASMDPDKHEVTFQGTVPRINILATYDINGRILVLPITGHGPANITFVNCKYDYKMTYDLEKKNGVDYIKVKTTTLSFKPERSWYQLDNLFNGDKLLAKQMQDFLYENWQELDKDLNPAFADVVNSLITDILQKVVTTVPYDKVFTP